MKVGNKGVFLPFLLLPVKCDKRKREIGIYSKVCLVNIHETVKEEEKKTRKKPALFTQGISSKIHPCRDTIKQLEKMLKANLANNDSDGVVVGFILYIYPTFSLSFSFFLLCVFPFSVFLFLYELCTATK